MASVKLSTWVLTVSLVFGLNSPSQCQSYSQTHSIFKDKLASSTYHTEIRPLLNQSKVIGVVAHFELLSIVEINDVAQSFTVIGFLVTGWKDEVIAWDPAKYGGQFLINPLPEQIWRPRLILMNTLGAIDPFNDDKAPVSVFSNGETYWTAGSLFSSSCQLHLTHYPFDTQTCEVKLFAMKYNEDELKFFATRPNVSLTYFTAHGEWNLEATELNIGTLKSGKSSISTIELKFYLRRRPSFLLLTIVLPVVFLSFLNILVFIIPVESGEKITYGITVLLALSVYMSIVSGLLPRSSLTLPNVTIYLFILLSMSMLSVIDSIVFVLLHNREEKAERALTKVATTQQAVSPTDHLNIDNKGELNKNASTLNASTGQLDHVHPEKTKDGDVCPQEAPQRINKYKRIGKHIDVVSFVVFLVFWLVTTLGFTLPMALQ
ncbi:unnamed protein product [Lymnaea stagnalis]|uniref:Uncharacterized protein n=1 Tax=Lymnaea stagnalis TaxID=6523 RepID=A0AAV2HLU1_LYMST